MTVNSVGAKKVGRRRRLANAFAEMHYRLRTEGRSPGRQAIAVWLGTLIGCVPLYGTHLLLCVGAARLFGVSRITTYLASHVNNPLTAPVLLYLEFGIGTWIFTDAWPALTMDELRSLTLWGLGRDLLTGGLVLGFALGAVLAAVTYGVGFRWKEPTPAMRLWEETSRPYLASGIIHWEFVRGKLRGDPAYRDLLASGLLPRSGSLTDLGCGRGIVLTLLQTAEAIAASGDWEPGWPPPPAGLELSGVELRPALAEVARAATGGRASIVTEDLRDHTPGSTDCVLLLDTLHYLAPDDQRRLIERSCRALTPGGRLILREADASLGMRFFVTRAAERACAMARMHWRQRFAYRSAAEWRSLLETQGLRTSTETMWRGTPFGNVLVIGEKEEGDIPLRAGGTFP